MVGQRSVLVIGDWSTFGGGDWRLVVFRLWWWVIGQRLTVVLFDWSSFRCGNSPAFGSVDWSMGLFIVDLLYFGFVDWSCFDCGDR